MDPLCSDQQIRDQLVLHEKCAQCSFCRCPLEGRCFERDGRLFCQVHYAELICSVPPPTTFCAGCHCRLEASDLVYKLKANIFYHVRCHRCAKCGRQLAQGEQIVVDERSRAVACVQHFLPTEPHEAPFGPTTRLNNDDGAQLHQFDQQQKLSSQFHQNTNLEGCNVHLGNIGTLDRGRAMSFDQQMPSASFEGIRANTSNAIDPCTAPEFGLAMAMGDELLREAQIAQELATVRRLTQMMADSQQQLDGINVQHHCHQALQQSPTCDFEFAVMMADSVVPSRGKGGDTGTEGGSGFGIGTLLSPGQIRHHDGHHSIADGMVASGSADDAVEFGAEIVQRIVGQQNEQQGKADANGKSRKLSHHETTAKGSPTSPASKCHQTQLDGHVLSSTLNTIKATVSEQERPKEPVKDGHHQKKKSKADAAAGGVGGVGRRTSSCSSTPVPVPQYPFEMYAAGEQFSRQEEEFQSGQGNKRRGPRTTISQQQLDILNDIFAKTPKPSKHARAKLAVDAGLSMRVIQVWFQNRRSKERRLKHLCNFLRHCDGQGPAVKEEQASAEEEAEATLLLRMAVKEERSEFDPDPE